jgi:Mn2+/Fe2+ NRAMP family transporter
MGAGLITGVVDDDPSGIAAYSQTGAKFGLTMLWTMELTYLRIPMIPATHSNLIAATIPI